MTIIQANISISDYVEIKIGPGTGRGHDGYYKSMLRVANKVTTQEQASDLVCCIDTIAAAVKNKGRVSLRGEFAQSYGIENPVQLGLARLRLLPYLGGNLGVEVVIREIERDIRKVGK